MKAIILAAGVGSRLAPITDDRPKCLVKLGGSSLLDHQISTLKSQGITDITVIGGYLAESITVQEIRLVVNPDFASSNMVYTLFCADDLFAGDSDLLISYGDIVYEPRVLKALLASLAPISVVVDQQWRRYWEIRMEDPLFDAETMKIDSNGMIKELGEKPNNYEEIEGQYIGLIKVRRDHALRLRQLYENMGPDRSFDGRSRKQMYMTRFLQYAIDNDWPVKAVSVSNGWLELDTYAEFELYRRMEADGTLGEFFRF